MPTYLSPGVYVEEIPSSVQAIAGVGTSTAAFIGIVPDTVTLAIPNPDYDPTSKRPTVAPVKPVTVQSDSSGGPGAISDTDAGTQPPAPAPKGQSKSAAVQPQDDPSSIPFKTKSFTIQLPVNEARLFTNFAEFRRYFGDFSTDTGHNLLVHAVFGFFNNGGSRCYVLRMTTTAQIDSALEKFEAVDEISIIAAPGIIDPAVRAAIVAHCDTTPYRFAILDGAETVATIDDSMLPPGSKNAAFYFPWLQVFDPGVKTRDPKGDGMIFVPPSGHMAGVYARVDNSRGVDHAPVEVVLGALGLRYAISKAQQDGLNPLGINCIREMNGNIRVWGARTIGGDRNGEWKYINVRRTFHYISKSIDEGTQWIVFEPNDLSLWAKITRNVSAFLTNVWHDGALFGSTASEAFFVKCDRETNPPELREIGQVVTEIGVAIVRPAEFVIFRISQWTGPEGK
jgi:phage tail sheath protein FI